MYFFPDTGSSSVQVFDREGKLVQIIGSKGDSRVSWLGRSSFIAADADGQIAVSVNPYKDDEEESGGTKSAILLLS
jgi:hypothetical protein